MVARSFHSVESESLAAAYIEAWVRLAILRFSISGQISRRVSRPRETQSTTLDAVNNCAGELEIHITAGCLKRQQLERLGVRPPFSDTSVTTELNLPVD
jgi:hypothetical protein